MWVKVFNNRSLRRVTKGFAMVRDLRCSGMLHARNISDVCRSQIVIEFHINRN